MTLLTSAITTSRGMIPIEGDDETESRLGLLAIAQSSASAISEAGRALVNAYAMMVASGNSGPSPIIAPLGPSFAQPAPRSGDNAAAAIAGYSSALMAALNRPGASSEATDEETEAPVETDAETPTETPTDEAPSEAEAAPVADAAPVETSAEPEPSSEAEPEERPHRRRRAPRHEETPADPPPAEPVAEVAAEPAVEPETEPVVERSLAEAHLPPESGSPFPAVTADDPLLAEWLDVGRGGAP